MELPEQQKKHGIHVTYVLAFIFSLAVAIPTYINSTFLTEFTSKELVGLIFALASVAAIIALTLVPLALRRFGNYRVSLFAIGVNIIALGGLAFSQSPIFLIILFASYVVAARSLIVNFDIFLESFSTDKATGSIRGAFLSLTNIAWIMAPVLAGFILGADQYWRVYLTALALMLLLVPIIIKHFRTYEDSHYHRAPFWSTLAEIYRRKNIFRVFAAHLLLRFFYAWMVIYTPIYLHETVGLPWTTIGIVFAVMLTPFVLFEYPLGRIADTRFGEKEIMIIGFVILAVSTGALAFITSNSAWVWATALFVTRIGASAVQIMSETYFFKKVSERDSALLGFFRMTGPMSYIVAPLFASIILVFIDLRFMFLILGVLMLGGIYYTLRLKDTL